MRDNLEEEFRRIRKYMELEQKMTNIFYTTHNKEGQENLADNLKLYLAHDLHVHANEDIQVNNIKVLDLSYFKPESYYDNVQKLLPELENNFYIIDCTQAGNGLNDKTIGQLSSFYYVAKDVKTHFLYVFKQKDMISYANIMEAWDKRTMTTGELDEHLATYRLYKDMSDKYEAKNLKEKTRKI